jgi:hypothetical protein
LKNILNKIFDVSQKCSDKTSNIFDVSQKCSDKTSNIFSSTNELLLRIQMELNRQDLIEKRKKKIDKLNNF